ncbi:putative thioesterase (yiiD_Cterm) [compost metagenome]
MNSGTSQNKLVETLQGKIKLYDHLGLSLYELTSEKVHFRVSLEENTNHKGTAFGGSIYSAAVMAAYGLVLHGLRERHILTENIVIQKGEIQYLKPIESDFEVICSFASAMEANAFYQTLQQTGRVKERLIVRVEVAGDLKALLKGVFVVKI